MVEKKDLELDENSTLHFPEDAILTYDKSGIKKDIESLHQQVTAGYSAGSSIRLENLKDIKQVVLTGMGSSAMAGDVLNAFLKQHIRIFVSRDYDLPEFTDRHTLLIVQSYSGNTEETVSAFRAGLRIGCKIVAISSGGRIEKMAQANRIPFVKLPADHQPRSVVALEFFVVLRILENAGLIPGMKHEVDSLLIALSKQNIEKTALDLSKNLFKKVPVIYASHTYYPVAFRWKTQFNENSKVMAFANEFPELDHNEIVGYRTHVADFHVVNLRFNDDSRRIVKRFEVTKKLIQEKGTGITEISFTGKSRLVQLFTAIKLGDLTSYFLALRYRHDPANVDEIVRLKKEMGPFI